MSFWFDPGKDWQPAKNWPARVQRAATCASVRQKRPDIINAQFSGGNYAASQKLTNSDSEIEDKAIPAFNLDFIFYPDIIPWSPKRYSFKYYMLTGHSYGAGISSKS